MRRASFFLSPFIAILSISAWGQSPPITTQGVPPFSLESHAGGGIDTINLGDLSVLLTIPINSNGVYGPKSSATLLMESDFPLVLASGGVLIGDYTPFHLQAPITYPSDVTQYGTNGCKGSVSGVVDATGAYHETPAAAMSNCGTLYLSTPGHDGWQVAVIPNSTLGVPQNDYFFAIAPDGTYSWYDPLAFWNNKTVSMYRTDLHGNTSTYTDYAAQGRQWWADAAGNLTATTAIANNPNPVTQLNYPGPGASTPSYYFTWNNWTVNANANCVASHSWYQTQGPANFLSTLQLPDGSEYQFTYEYYWGHTDMYTGRIASVTLPTGGTITYTYSGGTNGQGVWCVDGSAATITKTTPDGTWVFTHCEYGLAIAPTTCNTSAPSGWSSNLLATTTVTAPSGDYKIYSTVSYVPTDPGKKIVLPVQEQSFGVSGPGCSASAPCNLGSQVICYNGNTTTCTNPSTVPSGAITERDVYTYVAGVASPSLTVYTADTYERQTGVKVYDFGGVRGSSKWDSNLKTTYGSWNGSSCSAVTASTTVNTVFGNIPFTYPVMDRVCSEQLFVGGNGTTPVSTSYYTYNATGDLITQQDTIGGNLVTTATNSYDSLGRLTQSIGANGETTSTVYNQCSGQEPSSTTVKISSTGSLTTNYTSYDCTGERLIVQQDPSLNNWSTSYDLLWRPTLVTDAMENTAVYTYPTPTTKNVSLTVASGSIEDTLTQVDSMGRPQLSEVMLNGTSNYNITETDYDVNGRVKRVTLPYTAPAGTLNSTIDGFTYTYDGLDRVLTETGPAYNSSIPGTTKKYTYNANDTLVTVSPAPAGENPKSTQTEVNGLGEITSVCEVTSTSFTGSTNCGQANGANGLLTTYSYYPGGKLSTITQNALGTTKQVRSFTYDNSNTGRMLTATTPESGTNTTAYDTDPNGVCSSFIGLPVKTVDQGGGTTCFQYDLADRLITETFSGLNSGVTPTKNFVYDSTTNPNSPFTTTNGAGRLVEASTGTGAPAVPASGSFTIAGSEQSSETSTPTSGYLSGGLTVSGSEQTFNGSPGQGSISVGVSSAQCVAVGGGNYAPQNGTISLTIGSNSASTTWYGTCSNTTETLQPDIYTLAGNLASAITNSGLPVTGSAQPRSTVINLQARTNGVNTNYSFSTNSTDGFPTSEGGFGYSVCCSGSLGGGSDPKQDTGTVSATVNGYPASASYGSGSTAASVATSLYNSLNSSNSPVTPSGTNPIGLTSKATGAGSNYSGTATSSSSNGFNPPSFSISPSSFTFIGGANAQYLYDAGTVSVTIGTFTATVSYGSGDTATSIAGKLANYFNTTQGSPVTAKASGVSVTLTTLETGTIANFSFSGTSATQYSSVFASPSFSVSTVGSNLTGGQNSNLVTDELFAYDPDGRPSGASFWTSKGYSAYQLITESYFPDGQVNSLAVPTQPTINYGLDPSGRVLTATATSGLSPILSSTTYLDNGLPNVVTLGSGDTSTYTPYNNLQPYTAAHSIGTSSNNTITHTLIWNSNGSLASLQTSDQPKPANSQTCAFSYDDLERVLTNNCGANWNENYSYDVFGNITKSGSAPWPIPGGYSQSNNRYSSSAFVYDANGRLTNDTFDALGWDVNGNLITQSGTNFVYDAFDRPVMAGNSQYLYAPDGTLIGTGNNSGAVTKMFVPLPMSRAVYVSGVLDHYDRYDWQGSARVSSTASRTVYSDTSYDAFGIPYWSSGTINDQFAGLNTDISSGGEQVSATRRYHPTQGRWIAPDAIIPNTYSPQTFNAYHYALNQPTNVTDPGGRCPDWVTNCDYSQGVMGDWNGGYYTLPPDGFYSVYTDASGYTSMCNVIGCDASDLANSMPSGSNMLIMVNSKPAFGSESAANDAPFQLTFKGWIDFQQQIHDEEMNIPVGSKGYTVGDYVSISAVPIAFATGGVGALTSIGAEGVTGVGAFTSVGPSTAVRGGIGPVLRGQAGVQLSIAKWESQGWTLRGKEVTMETFGGDRARPDLLFEKSGQQMFVESKMGAGRLNSNQVNVYNQIRTTGAIPRGLNAAKAGLKPGVPIGPTPVQVDFWP